jgi:molybdate transport system ATP-binding protein
MLSVELTHRFGDFTLDMSFDAPAGVTVLFGRSGSGKTSIINAVAGLFHPDSGRIATPEAVLYDTSADLFVPPHKRRMGYVFQEARLFPHLSVRQNLLYGHCFAPKAEDARAGGGVRTDRRPCLASAQLLDRRPRDLSGGETAACCHRPGAPVAARNAVGR